MMELFAKTVSDVYPFTIFAKNSIQIFAIFFEVLQLEIKFLYLIHFVSMFLFTSVLSSILQVRNCLTHFWPMFSFYPLLETPENIPYIAWKHQKTFGFLVFHGDVKCVFWCFQGAQNGSIVQKWVNPFPKILRFGRCDVKRHNCEMSIYRLSLVFI